MNARTAQCILLCETCGGRTTGGRSLKMLVCYAFAIVVTAREEAFQFSLAEQNGNPRVVCLRGVTRTPLQHTSIAWKGRKSTLDEKMQFSAIQPTISTPHPRTIATCPASSANVISWASTCSKAGGGSLGGPAAATPDSEAEARRIKAGILEIVSGLSCCIEAVACILH